MKIHICVEDHEIFEESQSGYCNGEYIGMDEMVEVDFDTNVVSDEEIEEKVDELLRYDYDLGYIYDKGLLRYSLVD